MEEPELTREELEAQLMQEELGEESAVEGELPDETPQEAAAEPELTQEEIKTRLERLAELEEQLRQKSGALSEERDKRRVAEGQFAQIMDYLQEARNRAAEQQTQQDTEDYSEYQDYLDAWGKKYGPQVQQVVERLNQLETYIGQNYQQQQMTTSFAQQEQAFRQKQADYDDAMRFLVDKVSARLSIFVPDPQQRQAAVAQEVQGLMRFTPDKLYELSKAEGYSKPQSAPGNNQGQPSAPVPQERPRPKSLASLPGATGNLPNSWETQASQVVNTSFQDLNKLSLEELDGILKNMK